MTGDGGDDEAGVATPPLTAWTALAILALFYVLSALDRGLFALMSPSIQKSIHLSDVQLSLLQGVAFSLFFGVAGLPIGWAADRFSRRWVIFLGVIVWSISTAATGLASTFLTLFLPRAGIGAGEASLTPSAQSLLGDLFPRRRLAFAGAVYGISANVGTGFATIVGGSLLATLGAAGGLTLPFLGHLLPWQAACIILGLPGVLLAWLAFLIHEPRRQLPAAARAEASTWGDLAAFVAREPRLVILHMLGFPVAAVAIYTTGAWTPIYLTRLHHMGIAEIGVVLGLTTGVLGIAGNLIAGAVCDWLTRRGVQDAYYRMGVVTYIIATPAGVLAFVTGSTPLAIAGLAVFVLIGSCFAGSSTASLNLITPPRLRGKVFACFWLWMAAMGAMGPLAAATLTQQVFHDPMKIGWSVAIVLGVCMPLAALALGQNMAAFRRVARVN